MSFDMYVPTRTLFGAGMLNELHNQTMPGKRAMLVISNGKSVKENGYLSRTEEQLRLVGIESTVFDKVQQNPLKSTVMEGAAFVKENGCDFIIALGGGSCIDSAKAIAVMATNAGDLWDYISGGTGAEKPIVNRPLPIVTISTTAGTGSEANAGCVITNPKTNEKMALKSPLIFPVLCIEDPELMKSVPPIFTAYQGYDALSHNMEGYISKFANLMSDMYAITAIEHIGCHLADVVKDGNNMEAREHIAFGNILSGTVMCVGTLSSQHALAHSMSAYHQDLPHGAGLIMISKAYFTHIIEQHVCDDRFVRMAQAMGMDDAKEPLDFIAALIRLQEYCGVADLKMSDYGFASNEFETLAKNAKSTAGRLFECDRVQLTINDCIKIYSKSYR